MQSSGMHNDKFCVGLTDDFRSGLTMRLRWEITALLPWCLQYDSCLCSCTASHGFPSPTQRLLPLH
jgi:hypothetical protein